jgi:hypothetical protein
MSNIPFAVELRRQFNLTLESEFEGRTEYIQSQIQHLKAHLIDMAAIKKMEFSIFFREQPFVTWGNQRIKFPPPENAHVMPVDMKKAVVKFLREEGFYFDEWHEHIAINLIKDSKG